MMTAVLVELIVEATESIELAPTTTMSAITIDAGPPGRLVV